jgi:hypothetical protein
MNWNTFVYRTGQTTILTILVVLIVWFGKRLEA